MGEKDNRYHWVDVAKGLLILIVIFHHVPQVALSKGWDTAIWNGMNNIRFFYCCFFMAAFFIITGYCSNFNKEPKVFLWGSFKSLIIPAISITSLLFIINSLVNGTSINAIIRELIYIVLSLGGNWFLSSLLIARIVYWIINHYFKSPYQKGALCLVVMVIGFVLHDLEVKNVWFYQHAFAMTFFIFSGNLLKEYVGNNIIQLKKVFAIGTIVFLFVWVLLMILDLKIPSLNAGFKVSTFDIPLYVILSLSGSCLVYILSIIIFKNSFLEYLGKNSLTIYLFQIFFINNTLEVLAKIYNVNGSIISQLVTIALTLVVVIVLSIVVSILFNTKYLRIFLGK